MLLDYKVLDIMKYFLRDMNGLYYGSKIATEKKINQKTVSNILNSLEEKGVLKSVMAGKTKQFKFVFNDLSENYISIIENAKTLEFYKRNPKIRELIDKIRPFLKGIVIIFGSYAKGLQKKESDLDIFVVGSYDANKVKEIAALYKITINIKNCNKSKFILLLKMKDILINELLKDHILINNKETFVNEILRYYYGYN